jgi:multiple sugar transport system ATP-binding protein
MNRNAVRARVREAAERLGLENLLHRKPSQLSGGQRQRVALGRAIVREPAVFLMDEPLSNLDASLRVQMRAEIKRLQRELGTTTVYVTHDQVEAMTMGDRIAVMRDGQLRQLGAPATIYTEPADRFVAAFVGSPPMSFSTWSVRRDPTGPVLRRDECELSLGPVDPPLGDVVVVGVRPEDAVLWGEGGSRLLGPISGEVEFVEDVGREWFAGVKLDPGSGFVINGVTKPIPTMGARVTFGLRPGGVYLFDPESERCVAYPTEDRDAAVVGLGAGA